MGKEATDPYKIRCGLRIKMQRDAKKLSQEDLAAKVNRSVDTIGKIERGERWPSIQLLIDLSNVLDKSIDYFLMDQPHANPKYELNAELADILNNCSSPQVHLIVDMAKLIANTPLAEAEH